MKVEPDSMLVWYPKIKDIANIPQPKTEIVMLNEAEIELMRNEQIPSSAVIKVRDMCRKLGYPAFIRTDLASGKFDWDNSCFIKSEDKVAQSINGVVEFNLMADIMGLDFKALIVWLVLASQFFMRWPSSSIMRSHVTFSMDNISRRTCS